MGEGYGVRGTDVTIIGGHRPVQASSGCSHGHRSRCSGCTPARRPFLPLIRPTERRSDSVHWIEWIDGTERPVAFPQQLLVHALHVMPSWGGWHEKWALAMLDDCMKRLGWKKARERFVRGTSPTEFMDCYTAPAWWRPAA